MRKQMVIFLVIGVLLLSVFEALAAESNVIRVTTWGGSYKATYEKVVPLFEKEYDAKVEWHVGSNQSFMVQARMGQVDVVTNTILQSTEGEMEGLWAELDPKKISNMANLFKVAKHSKYTIYANVGPYNLIYNSKQIKTPPTSWDDLWNPAYKNRVILYPFHSVGTTCLFILAAQQKGGGIDNIEPGLNRLAELQKSGNLIGMPAGESEMISLYELEEAWIGPLTNGRVKDLWNKGASFMKIVRPKPTFGMITSMNVVKTSKNLDLAMKFVNFVLSPPVQEAYAKFNLYAPTVNNAKVPPEVTDLMLNEADMNRLFVVDWVAVNKVRAQWEERWNKMISK